MYAAEKGNAAVIKKLIDAGANADATTNSGMTALMVASLTGRTEAVKALIEKGADINIRSKGGMTASDYAKEGENGEIVELLSAVMKK